MNKNNNISSYSASTCSASPSTKATDQPLIDEHAVAIKLGVSRATLQAWRCTRRVNLPFIKVGRLVRYRQEDIDAFIASHLESQARVG
jgi:excisionase family DNA binding protein